MESGATRRQVICVIGPCLSSREVGRIKPCVRVKVVVYSPSLSFVRVSSPSLPFSL